MSETSKRHPVRLVAVAVGVLMVAFLIVLVVVKSGPKDSANSHLLGRPAPEIKTEILGGGEFNLGYRKGSWVLLNFFNSTCVPCVREHPELLQFMSDEATRVDPVELYTVINDDSDNAVIEFFKKNGGDWPKIKDDNGSIAVAFGVAKVPETWIIDPNGFVRMRITGEVTSEFLSEQMLTFRTQAGSGS